MMACGALLSLNDIQQQHRDGHVLHASAYMSFDLDLAGIWILQISSLQTSACRMMAGNGSHQ
jgi:hypothetical protein